jgi:hypothetical protein
MTTTFRFESGEAAPRPSERSLVKASPFVWIEPANIPRRQWLYGRHYVRKFISETVAPGAYGKSTLAITEALAIVTGRPLLGVTPNERAHVWVWNGEDPMEELQRRIIAAALRYEIDPPEIKGRFFVDTGRETKIIIAEQIKAGAIVARPIVETVITTIKANGIGLMIVDPFVASHRVVENDNPAIELVASAWAEIADVTDCAIELVHHARKTNGGAITVDDGRGGSALLAKVRSARTLNGMSKDEAARAGVENWRAYFRIQNGKANLAPPADAADWYRLESVDLGNGGGDKPGDSVGVVTRWTWPDAFEGVTDSSVRCKPRSQPAAGARTRRRRIGPVTPLRRPWISMRRSRRTRPRSPPCSRRGSRTACSLPLRGWTRSARSAPSLKSEPHPMTDVAAPRLSPRAAPRRTPRTPIGVVVRQPERPTCRTLPRRTFVSAATRRTNAARKDARFSRPRLTSTV